MTSSPRNDPSRPVAVSGDMVVVTLSDGRSISTPRLESASPADLAEVELTPLGVHWPRLDEDLSIEGMLAGRRPTVPR